MRSPLCTHGCVDVGNCGDSFFQNSEGFAVKGACHTIDDEPGCVSGGQRFPPRSHFFHGLFCQLGSGLQGRDHFNQGHQRGRIEEVQSNDPLWMRTSTGQGRDGKRGGVGGENCSLGNDGSSVPKQRCFCGQVFHYGFHNGIALGQGLQVCGPGDPCFDFLSKCLGQAFFLHQPSKHL